VIELFNFYYFIRTTIRNIFCTTFRKICIRIVYHIIGGRMEIIEILAIGNRSDYEVYEDAHKRLNW
jgi:hypothetical protein